MRFTLILCSVILFSCASQPKEAKIWTAEEVLAQLDQHGKSLGDLENTSAIRITDEDCNTESSSFAFIVGGISKMQRNLDYPLEARKNRIEGNVITRFTIGIDGKVEAMQILSNTDPLLNNSVKKMLKKTDFAPALCNSKLVPSSYTITNTFRTNI